MNFQLDMLQAARLAAKQLGEAADRVRQFVRCQQNPDGSFNDRSGRSDLYYTVFGLECLIALQEPLPEKELAHFLSGFGHGESLDLVHLTCLVRCWSILPPDRFPCDIRDSMIKQLDRFLPPSTVYEGFLAYGACLDLQRPLPDAGTLAYGLGSMRSQDGAYGNTPNLPLGSTTATAAAVLILQQLDQPIPTELAPWLLQQHRSTGGFVAMPQAPMPDLLSTATALHALASMRIPLDAIREPCLDFIDSLWSNDGGFYGHWADDILDVEYTRYALLALGHLYK